MKNDFLRSLPRLLLVTGALLLIGEHVIGIGRDRTISQFHHAAWTRADGSPGQIRAITQTVDGFLWLGTASGLYRFDGLRFEPYKPRSGSTPLPSNDVYSLLPTPDGGLFVGYGFAGVSYIKDGTVTNFGEADGLPPGRLRKFARESDGTVWAAAAGGLARYRNSRWETIGAEYGFPGKTAQTVYVDSQGTVWAASEDTVLFLPKGNASFQPTFEKTGQVLNIAQSPDGSIWVAETSRSVRQLRYPETDPSKLGPEIRVGSVSILFDRDGTFWISTIGDGLRRLRSPNDLKGRTIAQFGNEAEIFTEEDGLTSNYFFTIFEDREGNIWCGSANGLDRFRAGDLVPIRFPSAYQDFGLAAGDNGEIWTGSSNSGLNLIQGNVPLPVTDKIAVSAIYRDFDGTIWVAGTYGIYRLNGKVAVHLGMPAGLKVFGASSIFIDRSSVLWALTDLEGIFTYKDGEWERLALQAELPNAPPITGSLDSLDRKWFGYAGNRIAVIDGPTIRAFSQDDGLAVGDVTVINEVNGSIWIGGSLGVAMYDGSRFHTLTGESLEALAGVSGIVEAGDGSLWLNASAGIVEIPASEISQFRENPGRKVAHRLFDFLDGLPGATQQKRPFPTAARGSDGRLWFATSKGVAWADPARVTRETSPTPVVIRYLHANDLSLEPLPATELAARTTRLRFEYTALNLSMPERIRFRYRLTGLHEDWRDADDRREVSYTNLGPGNYRFEVVASDPRGAWNGVPAQFKFSILPAFYQTYWFYSLCALTAAVLVWLGYRWRVRSIESRLIAHFRERLAERRRIAQDLHDDLLQGFVSASMQLSVASDLLPDDSNVKGRLQHIESQLRTVVEKGRMKVSSLRTASGDNHLYLDESLGETLAEIKGNYTGDVCISSDGEPRYLTGPVHDAAYHIAREAIINAIRHSRADNIEVRISYKDREFVTTVRDDGDGIDPATVAAGKDGHWGLTMMKERAEEVGADFHIWTTPSSGTEIKVSIPSRAAYANDSNGDRRKS